MRKKPVSISKIKKTVKKKTAVRKSSVSSLKLRVAKALDILRDLPELTANEQVILRRIQDISTGVSAGRLTQTDYINIKKIAAKHRAEL